MTDISCTSDLFFDEVDDRSAIAQRIFRKLTTPTGRLIDDPNWGIDLNDLLNDDMSKAEADRIRSRIKMEVEEDESVKTADVSLSLTSGRYLIKITLTLETDSTEISLSIAVDNVSATMLEES